MKEYELKSFLEDKDVRFLAQRIFLLNKSIINIENASDFDVFDALCSRLYLFACHPIRERLLKLLSSGVSSEIEPDMLYDREYRKALWQKIFIDGNIDLLDTRSEIKIPIISDIENTVFCINSKIDIYFTDIHSLLEATLVKIRDRRVTKLFFDARTVTFSRPDDFHAQIAYNSLKNGDNNSSLLELWLLCRILMNTDIPLSLRVENTKKAENILNLIFRLGLSPKIIIGFDISDNIDYSKIYELLSFYGKKNISLEIFCSKENIDRILEFANIVPLTFVEKNSVNAKILEGEFASVLSKYERELLISHLGKAK